MKALERLFRKLGGSAGAKAPRPLSFGRHLADRVGKPGAGHSLTMFARTGVPRRRVEATVVTDPSYTGSSFSAAVGHPLRRVWDCVRRAWDRRRKWLEALVEECAKEYKEEPDWLGAQVYPLLKKMDGCMAYLLECDRKRRERLGLPPLPPQTPSPARFPD